MSDIRRVDFYPNDWIAGIATLDVVDVGIFATAEAMMYSHGGPIQKADLKRFVRCHGKAFENALARLIASGRLILNGSQISSKRCLNELEKARERIAKWSENGSKGGRPSKVINDLPKPNGSYARAHPPTTNHQLPEESPPTPPRPSPDEGAPERSELRSDLGQAAPAEEDGDFKIPEKWIEEARDERRRRDLPELDLHELGRQTINRWRHDPPRNRRLAWRGRAMTATLNPSLVPSPSRVDRQEETRLIEAAKQRVLAQLRAGTYVWETAA